MIISATKVLDIGLSQCVTRDSVCPHEKTVHQAQLFRSKARHLSKEWVLGVAPQPLPQKTYPGFRRPGGLCAGGGNLITAKELSPLIKAQDIANSDVLCGLKMSHGLRHQSNRSFRKHKTSFEWVTLIPEGQESSQQWGLLQRGHCLLEASSQASARCPRTVLWGSEGEQNSYWDPGSEERTPDFRTLGGGGGGTLASLRTGSGGAIWGRDTWKEKWVLSFFPILHSPPHFRHPALASNWFEFVQPLPGEKGNETDVSSLVSLELIWYTATLLNPQHLGTWRT